MCYPNTNFPGYFQKVLRYFYAPNVFLPSSASKLMDSQSQSVVGLTETIKNRICGLQQDVLVPRTADAESPVISKDKVSPKQPFVIGNCHVTFVYPVFVIN